MTLLKVTIIFIILSPMAWAECPNKIDTKKVILFIDLNLSDLEIETAFRAACQRGEKLQVVPKNYKAYTKTIKARDQAYINFKKCMDDNFGDPCKEKQSIVDKFNKELDKFPVLKTTLEETIQEIKNKKANIVNITLSGHNGGSEYSGAKGKIDLNTINRLLKENPEINKIQSLNLLGCFSATKNEIGKWKYLFPEIKLIAGYDGRAPLSDKPLGHQYLEEILVREKSLLSSRNPKTLQNILRRLQGLTNVDSSLYLSCGEGQDYYYSPQETNNRLLEINHNDCKWKEGELEELSARAWPYIIGDKEPPPDSDHGELTEIYSIVRREEHCLQGHLILDANQLFNLRFYDNVKMNFARFFNDDIMEAEKIINSINPKEVISKLHMRIREIREEFEKIKFDSQAYQILNQRIKDLSGSLLKDNKEYLESTTTGLYLISAEKVKEENRESYEKTKLKLAELEKMNNELYGLKSTHIQKVNLKNKIELLDNKIVLIDKNPDFFKKLWMPNESNLMFKSRKELRENIHELHSLLAIEKGLTKEQNGALSFLNDALTTHLRNFRNPFSWHELSSKTEAPQDAIGLKKFIEKEE